MKKKNIVKEKSFKFAIHIVKFYQYIVSEKKEYILSKQLLRSGTSVGAMTREAEHSESKAFIMVNYKLLMKEKLNIIH